MTRTAWAALATAAVLTAIYAHMLNQPRRPWDEWDEVDLRG